MSKILRFSEKTEREKSIVKNNLADFVGTAESAPEYSHENFGKKYYMFNIITTYKDRTNVLPVQVTEDMLKETPVIPGKGYFARGRWANKRMENGFKNFLFAKKLIAIPDDEIRPKNHVVLDGYVKRNPFVQKSYDKYNDETKKQVCILISVPRPAGKDEDGENVKTKSDTVTVVFRGESVDAALQLKYGERIEVMGFIEEEKDKDGKLVDYPVVVYSTVKKIEDIPEEKDTEEEKPASEEE